MSAPDAVAVCLMYAALGVFALSLYFAFTHSPLTEDR
jgi:hypothetical protein